MKNTVVRVNGKAFEVRKGWSDLHEKRVWSYFCENGRYWQVTDCRTKNELVYRLEAVLEEQAELEEQYQA